MYICVCVCVNAHIGRLSGAGGAHVEQRRETYLCTHTHIYILYKYRYVYIYRYRYKYSICVYAHVGCLAGAGGAHVEERCCSRAGS